MMNNMYIKADSEKSFEISTRRYEFTLSHKKITLNIFQLNGFRRRLKNYVFILLCRNWAVFLTISFLFYSAILQMAISAEQSENGTIRGIHYNNMYIFSREMCFVFNRKEILGRNYLNDLSFFVYIFITESEFVSLIKSGLKQSPVLRI